jgi:hypothetical protein
VGRRTARLLRWYPPAWRARYGDEFTELLIAEFTERPRSWRRAVDVARGGLLARLTGAGGAAALSRRGRGPGLTCITWAVADIGGRRGQAGEGSDR